MFLKLSLVCISIYSSLLYIHYNLPVFQQLFAHYFYTETEDFNLTRSGFGCMTINAHRSVPTIMDRNESIQLNGSASGKSYEYEVGENKYFVRRYSYISIRSGCSYAPQKIFYYSKVPSWAVSRQ